MASKIKTSISKKGAANRKLAKAESKQIPDSALAAEETVTKKYATLREAAAHCGVSDPTLSNYINRHPDLPVVSRSTGKEGYKIDLIELDAWRERTGKLNWRPPTLRGENSPGISDTNRKAKIEADLLQLKYDTAIGKVVDRQEVVKMLSTRMAQFGKRIDAIPAIISRKCAATPEMVETIRKLLDEARYALSINDNGYFEDLESDEVQI